MRKGAVTNAYKCGAGALLGMSRFSQRGWLTVGLLFVCLTLSAAPADAQETVTLQLKWTHAFQFAGYYAAKEQGYYGEAGLDVTIEEATPETDPVASVLEGKAQYGVGTSSLLLARAAGKPVVVLAVVFQQSPYEIYAAPEIRTLKDLIGKRLMLEPQSEELLAYLKKEGVPLDRVRQVPHSFDADGLIQGKAEAISGYISNQPYYFTQANYPYRTFSPRSAGIDFYGDNLFTSEQELRDHPDRVRAFRAASMRGWQYAKEHRDEVIDLILAKYSKKHTRDYLRFESDQMIPLLQPDLIEIGYMNPNRWRHIADTYAGIGVLPADYPLEGFLYEPDPGRDSTLLYRYGAIAVLLIGLSIAISLYIYRINRRLARTLAERWEAGEAERQARGFGEAIIASIPGAFYMLDAAGRFVRWNAYQRDEIVGKTDDEMPQVNVLDTIHPDDRRLVSSGIASGFEEAVEGRVLLRGGPAFRWFLMTGRQVMLGGDHFLVGAGVDITERRRTDLALAAAKAQAEAVNHDLEEANRQLETISITDSLTGIANRRRFDEMLLHEWRRAMRSQQPLALAMLDLDWFKDYNDRYGHQAGDRCLRVIAKVLQTQARRSSDLAARYGGDEFVIIAPETNVESMLRLAQAIHEAPELLALPSAQSPFGRVTVSIGVAVQVPTRTSRPEMMLRLADEALYRAKEQGRDQTVLAAESP